MLGALDVRKQRQRSTFFVAAKITLLKHGTYRARTHIWELKALRWLCTQHWPHPTWAYIQQIPPLYLTSHQWWHHMESTNPVPSRSEMGYLLLPCPTYNAKKMKRISTSNSSPPSLSHQWDTCPAWIPQCPSLHRCISFPKAHNTFHSS